MFCPRCATQNADDAKYCRACRENLKVISQAMSRHLPVVLASKLDEFIERRDERLRRDGIIFCLVGVISILISILGPTQELVWLPILGCCYLAVGTWSMLAQAQFVFGFKV